MAVIAAALGFGGAWLVFEDPFSGGKPSRHDVEAELQHRESAHGSKRTVCVSDGENRYRCEVDYGAAGNAFFRATVHGSSMSFRLIENNVE